MQTQTHAQDHILFIAYSKWQVAFRAIQNTQTQEQWVKDFFDCDNVWFGGQAWETVGKIVSSVYKGHQIAIQTCHRTLLSHYIWD